MFGSVVRSSGLTKRTTLIISKEEMKHIMKIVKSLEESGSLINSISEPIQNEAKGQKGGLLSILLRTLDAILFGIILTDKGTITAVEGTIREGQDF